jgi:hypothetical protein
MQQQGAVGEHFYSITANMLLQSVNMASEQGFYKNTPLLLETSAVIPLLALSAKAACELAAIERKEASSDALSTVISSSPFSPSCNQATISRCVQRVARLAHAITKKHLLLTRCAHWQAHWQATGLAPTCRAAGSGPANVSMLSDLQLMPRQMQHECLLCA